jgi:hypothetical protein
MRQPAKVKEAQDLWLEENFSKTAVLHAACFGLNCAWLYADFRPSSPGTDFTEYAHVRIFLC